jgi:predicted amidohydrolase
MSENNLRKLRVASLQLEALDLPQANEALQRALALIDRAAAEYQPDLIVTPECTYPAYVLGNEKEFKANYPGDPLPHFAEKARQHKCHIIVGLATPTEDPDGKLLLYNEAVLFSPTGDVIGRTAKSLLWHFDSKWFCPGTSYPVFDTEIGRIGMIVCADGRQPEISRILALQGAQIIVDPTAWVTYGTDRQALTNPQADFMLATRAFENGVWCVASDKVGLERGTVLYAGRSSIISPEGKKVAVGSSYKEEIVFAEIELKPRPLPSAPRYPSLYHDLVKPIENQPIHFILQEAIVPHRAHIRATVAQYRSFTSTEEMGEVARTLLKQLTRESADLVVLPDIAPGFADEAAQRGDLVFPFYRILSKLSGVAILATAVEHEGIRRYKTARLFQYGIELGMWRQTHFTAQDEGYWTPAPQIGSVIKLNGSEARIGVMLGADGYGPEVARCLMLKGADVILYPTRAVLPTNDFSLAQLVRSRASENRVYVLAATPLETLKDLSGNSLIGSSLIADPSGAVIAPALPDTAMAVSAQLMLGMSRNKLSAPGTDAVYNRMPDAYHMLVEDENSGTSEKIPE